MLSSKETLCRAGIVKIEKLEEIELCTEFPRRSGIVKHTDFRFLFFGHSQVQQDHVGDGQKEVAVS